MTEANWFEVLSDPEVKVAAASPIHDPCGYWTELCWKLADLHYAPDKGGGRIATTMNAQCGQPDRRRADSQQLMQLLETRGGLDYAFLYRSQALQHNLPFLRLPPEINLGSASHLDNYRRVSMDIPADKRGETFTKRGDAIVFAITIPRTVRHRDWAEQFVAHVLSDRSRSILENEYLTLVEQPWTHDPAELPERFRDMVSAPPRITDTESRPSDADGR
jgi:molybdate/tungstate transport system substrate-binding protein